MHLTDDQEARLRLLRLTAQRLGATYEDRDYHILTAREEGVPVARIAEALGMSRRGVYFRLKALGVD